MSKTEKMRARRATMAKEREDFVAQKSALEAEMKASSLGKLAPAAVAEQQEALELASGATGGPRPPLLKRRSSGVGFSDTPTSSQSQLTPYNSSSNLLSNAVPMPGGSRISDWAFSSIVSMDAATDAPPVVKVNEVYETVRNLGRGAFGDVFLVRNVEDSRLFADKTIFCEKESLFADILRELFFLRKYRHPYIIDIQDGFVIAQPRVLHIIMSYCEAGDLGKVITLHRRNKSSISEAQAFKWMLQIALAMAFLHENGVLHRDLKPCNVMLTEGGEVCKVCDFGLALEASPSEGGGTAQFQSSSEAGTPYYTAPEMVQGKKYSFPADCWSYGIMIHELLALSRPFEGAATADLVKAILLNAPPPCPAHYSDVLRSLVLGFLVKDPASRLGFAGLLTDTPLVSRVSAIPQSYRPKALEERIKRAHVKQLVGQIEVLAQAKNSSLKGMPQPSLAAAEAAAAVPAIVVPGAPEGSPTNMARGDKSPISGSPYLGAGSQKKRFIPSSTPPEQSLIKSTIRDVVESREPVDGKNKDDKLQLKPFEENDDVKCDSSVVTKLSSTEELEVGMGLGIGTLIGVDDQVPPNAKSNSGADILNQDLLLAPKEPSVDSEVPTSDPLGVVPVPSTICVPLSSSALTEEADTTSAQMHRDQSTTSLSRKGKELLNAVELDQQLNIVDAQS